MIKRPKIKLIITFALFCITGLLAFLSEPDFYPASFSGQGKEMFNPQLKRLNSMNKIIAYSDSVYADLKLPAFDTSRYVRVVSGTVKKRFYHGLSNYSLSKNWISHVLGKICWSHLSAIVNPEDILKYSEGLCSQQNIIFMKILERKGVAFRTVGLGTTQGPGHFLCEVKYNNSWHLYDVDLEPNWKTVAEEEKRESLDYYLYHKDLLYKVYEGKITRSVLDKLLNNVSYGKPNVFPAKTMLMFHQATKVLTYLLPIFFLLMFIWCYKKYKSGF